MKKREESTVFFIKNLLKGLLWLAILVTAYILLKDRIDPSYLDWLKPIYEYPELVYLIFAVSEILIGMIPPEVFMIWAASDNIISKYIYIVFLLSAISYAAGVIGYWIGIYFNQAKYYRFLKRKFFGKYEKYLNRFGGFLIIVAAMTPVPFSGVAMLVGSIRYSFKKYLLFSSTRFLRFAAYAYVIWQAHAF